MAEQFWLSDVQWAVLEPLLPQLGGKPRVDDRRVISGILHRYRQGLTWRAIPAEYLLLAGQRPAVWLVSERAVAVELESGEQGGCGGGGVVRLVVGRVGVARFAGARV